MVENKLILNHEFLRDMYSDPYFPKLLVDKGKLILLELCEQVEVAKPANLDAVYKLTHAATERFNRLQEDFYAADSEIETAAREAIAEDFAFIASAYGWEADTEELIATRDW